MLQLTRQIAAGVALVAAVPLAIAKESPEMLFRINCSGCHQVDGTGSKFIPPLKGHISEFLASPRGREYVVRVPGMAQSVLSTEELTRVLNWMLPTFDRQQMPANFVPYTEAEVAELRSRPLSDPSVEREKVLQNIRSRSKSQHQ